MNYSAEIDKKILMERVNREQRGELYNYSDDDSGIISDMFSEINKVNNLELHYIAELDMYIFPGAGKIIAKYINMISSQEVRAYLIPQMVADKVENVSLILLKLYEDFKKSNCYISLPGQSDPAHIYVRYDNAFAKMKDKRIKDDLIELIKHPRDAFYLPLTVRMLAKQCAPAVREIVMRFIDEQYVTPEALGLVGIFADSLPTIETIKRELKFTTLHVLRYCDDTTAIEILNHHLYSDDADIRQCAKASLDYISLHKT